MAIRFVFGVHNHQPVGNFGSVFEQAYRDGYKPLLDLLQDFPEIPVTIHNSGCLLEWIVEQRPDYVSRLAQLVAAGRAEILGGAFYEPILSMLPSRDRLGQIRTFTTYLHDLFHCEVRGLWLAERVWEPELAGDLADAGIEYTLLDDYHFRQAGLEEDQLFGYYLTEDQGKLIRVFPISEPARYLVPWKSPEDALAYLRHVNERFPNAVVVCADDGEKFGVWPETYKHVYTNGWLRRFFELLRQNWQWIHCCTLSQALDETVAAGTIYLPDCSYREMTEWALPARRLEAYNRMVQSIQGDPREGEIKRFLRGGFWRNFKAKYPEVQEMYCRMLEVSRRVQHIQQAVDKERAAAAGDPSPQPQRHARQELYRGQCNCSYWHGAFGGLYLPHLRNAVYHHLIAADNALEGLTSDTQPLVTVEVHDFNLDTVPEVRLNNSRLNVYIAPHLGGMIYELDIRSICHNVLATLARRREVYHETIVAAAGGQGAANSVSLIAEPARFKQQGLERLLLYDRQPRKSLIDHFYEPSTSLDDLVQLRENELGDFVQGSYTQQVNRSGTRASLLMQRAGRVSGQSLKINKEVTLDIGQSALTIRYMLENLPKDRPLRFGVEFNFAGMAAGQDDRYFYHDEYPRAGQLQTPKDLANQAKFGLVDEWLGLDASLSMSRPGGIWAFPIQTVSQSEGGFELVHQSTTVIPHWLIEPDAAGRWVVMITLRLDTSRADAKMVGGSI